jgi:hypothetical protein
VAQSAAASSEVLDMRVIERDSVRTLNSNLYSDMKRTDRKSHRAVNFALEAIGDPWSLLIVPDIVFDGNTVSMSFSHPSNGSQKIFWQVVCCNSSTVAF